MTSRINTLVDVAHIEATSSAASRVEIATYFATEPKPGQLSVMGKSLSMVFAREPLDWVVQALADFRNLEAGVGRITTTVIKEIANIVGLENIDQAFIFRAILFDTF